MRPQFHFTADGWINDPHGITVVNGTYHLFFQYVPGSTSWNLACSWGHASGEDLFSLIELPVALQPGEGDDGVWSGTVHLGSDGVPRIFYTSVSAQNLGLGRIRTATPSDAKLITWNKGPVVAAVSPDAGIRAFRDPVIIDDDGALRMLVGAELANGAAAAVGFSSPDGLIWRETGVVAARPNDERDPVWSGSMWECPQLVEIDGRHALIVSVWENDVLHDVVFASGAYDDGSFSPSQWGRLSYGPSPYAATTFRDASGHACIVFWLRHVSGTGWAGAHSIPYRLSLSADGMGLTPHPDIERYHQENRHNTRAADILWPADESTSLQIHEHGTTVISIDRDESELSVRIGLVEHRVPWAGDVRIIVDGPILEISSDKGLFASPIEPMGEQWELVGSGLACRWLGKHAGP